MEEIKIVRTIKVNISSLLSLKQKEIIDGMFISSSKIYQTILKAAKQERTTSSVKLHKLTYYMLKDEFPSFPTAYLQSIRDCVIGSVKSFNTNNPKKKFEIKEFKGNRKSIPMSCRAFSHRGDFVTFSTTEKRFKLKIEVPTWFKETYPELKKASTATLTQNKDGYFLNMTFKETIRIKNNSTETIGLDRGLYNLVATSNGELFSGKKIRAAHRRYLFTRKTLQQKGTQSAKRKLKSNSGKEKRFMRDVNHCISKKLASKTNVKTYVLEDLAGIRKQSKGKKLNKWLSDWSYFQLETFLIYKCQKKGVEVVKVDPRYTSQTCSVCGAIKKQNRHKNSYICSSCGHEEHADINAAKNIRNKFLLSLEGETGCVQSAICNKLVTIPTPCGLGI
jgi:IS605 OrfB family transposase